MAVEEGDLPLLDLHLGLVVLEVWPRHKLLLGGPAPAWTVAKYWHTAVLAHAKLECCREKEPRQSLGRVRTVSRDIYIFVFYDTVFLHFYTEEIK